ncbi:LysM peptidoglycan-binding domain-containing protein [Luteolibacter sp. SL250]|uniref:LysM peptidoglycan-binding domain-containing protein n=1 Tax=Luteolibacter sp. SL250 TaxID=2995170 RepID=UPI00226E53FF|nr:LysM peptidoglycan-binding domain-containing protein [Luteolibacter sp. SL250]WAC20968.1 LysM peptidoglycan-binding domain-containing protein [Luteolibacter sp. SL250]
MKSHTLPVKRTPASKGIFKRLSAVTRSRKQRAATATADDMFEHDDHSSKISRALTIIFLIHIVVIGLIFFHQKFLDKGAPATEAVVKKAAVVAPARELPKLSDGGQVHRVKLGDNYDKIAAAYEVDVEDLRAANNHVDIVPSLLMKIPPRKVVAMTPPEVEAITNPDAIEDNGLVEAVPLDTTGAPRAQLVRPAGEAPAARQTAAAAPPVKTSAASGQKYVVKSGDNIWRISNKFKVDQKALMRANGISDPKKLKLGMTLTIP